MFDVHGIIRHGCVQIGDTEWAAIFRFCVIVFETQYPFASRRFCSALAQRRLNGGNRTQVAVDHAKVHDASHCRVGVGINEARQHGLSAEVHLSNAGRREIHHVGVFPNGEKSATRYGYSLRNRVGQIHRHDVAVMKDQVRLFLFKWKERKSGNRA